MNGNNINIVNLWLKKAQNDLDSAKILGSGRNKILDTAIYHCQQAAEKSIKAFLIHSRIDFIKTHDLVYLVKLAMGKETDLIFLLDYAVLLTPYSVEFRYPDDTLEPDIEEFRAALEAASEFLETIKNTIDD